MRRSAEPSPATPGPVALVGSGEFLPVMEAVDAGLLAGRPARAVFLPTAAGQEGPDRVGYWLRLATGHYRRLGVEPVPLAVLDRDGARDGANASRVAGAGLVYLSGGNPAYLADTLRDTPVLEAIVAAWRAGAALAGCSAGACALTDVAADIRAGAVRPGLALVPGLVVLPHFDRIEQWRPAVVGERLAALAPGQTLIGVDEDTALVRRDGGWGVEGRQRVRVIGADGRRTGYEAGASVPLPST